MDLVKELRDVIEAVRQASADGRITPGEALLIAKEVAELVLVLYRLLGPGFAPVYRSFSDALGELERGTDRET
jgi:hypothetical protein